MDSPASQIIDRAGLQDLFALLIRQGFTLVGPTLRDGAIVYDRLVSLKDLPAGWTDEQDGGIYRLKRRSDEALFGYAVGPQSWKKFLFPPMRRLWTAVKEKSGFQITEEKEEIPRLALIGVRSCELHALDIQDRVFLNGEKADPFYKKQRENLFIVALNCGVAGGTCFCVSMNTGPRATFGFDLALTEILEGPRHYFVLKPGTERGAEFLRQVSALPAGEEEHRAENHLILNTAEQMGRTLDTAGIKELLYQNLEHPRWDQTAARCLACGNCTMVCPTCFCSTVEEVNDLGGQHTERWLKWDSCFTLDFSHLHGSGSVRSSHKSRYRQWMTHKLATWIDQFGTSGCVGCGRCITWCPVAIDLTEEVRMIRKAPGAEFA